MASVREMVHDAQRELLKGDPTPAMSRDLLVRLTSLLGNVMVEQREADAAYLVVLDAALTEHSKANRARIKAEATPEFARKREAHDTRTLLVEMIRTLKANQRSLSDEMELTR
jgi:hypothetical protein